MKRMLICFAATAILLLSGAKAFSGDLECYEYTSTTSHFECGNHGNCVWWAAYMRPDIAAVISGSGWNSGEWYDNLIDKGFDVGSEPKIGAIVEFSNHVAYVMSLGENGSFGVSEMNWFDSPNDGFTDSVNYATYYKGSGNTYHRNIDRGSSTQGTWILNGFIYRNPSGENSYCADINSLWGICWEPSDTDVSCQGGKDWRLYDYEQGTVIIVSINEYCPECDGAGGGNITPPQPITYDSQNLPNLRIYSVGIFDPQDHELNEQKSYLEIDKIYAIRVYPISEENDCVNGVDQDIENVETDIYVKISNEDSDGTRVFLKRVYTRPSTLVEGDPHKETAYYIIPPEAKNQRVYFEAEVDSTQEVKETNEEDNLSYWQKEWYPVKGDLDLTISTAQLVGNLTTIPLNTRYRLEMAIRNIGPDTPLVGIQSAYYLKKPGETVFTEIEQDGSDASELTPNRYQWEVTPTDGYLPDRIGIHEGMVCTDINNNLPETDETNNCKTFSFEVVPVGPNLYIADIYFKVGSTIYRNGATIPKNSYVHPYVQIGNNGNSSLHPPFHLAYYINADKYRDSDGVDQNQVGLGNYVTEYVSTDSIRLGDTGNRTYRVVLDYQGAVTELNETDNSATISFRVR